ncbi:conserved exported protein of unknown function [Denitratisoma oestradiolicum]|uniref:Uncharacterized protein n=2 Tax=Denitratisoma oestradiolicum TaxID=311182 RepID=A0A6S6Y0I7_9PROT|nr:conserved exported protein of unknown function [Denitratisoma oestradiolicum]
MPRNREVNLLPCVFCVALTARMAACELATTVVEGSGTACSSPLARAACASLYGLLQERASFALKLRPGRPGPLAWSRALQVQCGGLLFLKETLDPQTQAPDIHRLVYLAQQHPGGADELPAAPMIRRMTTWRNSSIER